MKHLLCLLEQDESLSHLPRVQLACRSGLRRKHTNLHRPECTSVAGPLDDAEYAIMSVGSVAQPTNLVIS